MDNISRTNQYSKTGQHFMNRESSSTRNINCIALKVLNRFVKGCDKIFFIERNITKIKN